jgi:hypothetical protein
LIRLFCYIYEDREWNSADNVPCDTSPDTIDWEDGHNYASVPSPTKQPYQSPSRAQTSRSEKCWGQNHPEFNSPKTRICWSEEENGYIRKWWRDNSSKYPTHVTAKLLEHIRNDKIAQAIFHPNHILDSSRIRHGLRANGINK